MADKAPKLRSNYLEEINNSLLVVGTEPAFNWISDATYDRIRDAWHKDEVENAECLMCGYKGQARRVKLHARQHYTRHFCQCGYTDVDRTLVVNHRKKHEMHHSIYSVDVGSYAALCDKMNWERSDDHFPCQPHWDRKAQIISHVNHIGTEKPSKSARLLVPLGMI